jgi:2-polyprenyl-3-methyl-5-hydroxy-6-metoxy-1,4-benzoquinol methylase
MGMGFNMARYDKYYEQENYFGNAYPELIGYFNGLDKNLKILDIGCGQGRDSLALGRLGFEVLGVDVSSVGVAQMNSLAKRDDLNVKGIVHDLNEFEDISSFDIVLFDTMFHFYKKDLEHEIGLLSKYLKKMKKGARLVIVLQKSEYRIKIIKEIIEKSENKFEIEYENSFNYSEFNSLFYMISLRKKE